MRSYLELCKVRISLFAAFSAASGFFLAFGEFRADMLLLMTGVFVLACGSSALNQYQERNIDAVMGRTRNRPVPSKRISPSQALYFSAGLICSGLVLLFLTGYLSALLGLSATLWYNGLYTCLKRKTAFAVIPGALVGAVPPLIGWVFGGGALRDPRLPALCFFYFMWQIPHFWIILLNCGREYKEAGLPSLSDIFSATQLTRLTSQWIFAAVVSCLFISLYGLVRSSLVTFLLLVLSLSLSLEGMKLMRVGASPEGNSWLVFRRINYYMLSVIIFMSFDRLTYAWTEHGLRAFLE